MVGDGVESDHFHVSPSFLLFYRRFHSSRLTAANPKTQWRYCRSFWLIGVGTLLLTGSSRSGGGERANAMPLSVRKCVATDAHRQIDTQAGARGGAGEGGMTQAGRGGARAPCAPRAKMRNSARRGRERRCCCHLPAVEGRWSLAVALVERPSCSLSANGVCTQSAFGLWIRSSWLSLVGLLQAFLISRYRSPDVGIKESRGGKVLV